MIYQEPVNLSDLLKVEVCVGWTKESGVIKTEEGQTVELGTVLAEKDGHFVIYDPTQHENAPASAIAAELVYPESDLSEIVAIARGAVVDAKYLVWADSITDEQKALAIQSLKSKGILVKETL